MFEAFVQYLISENVPEYTIVLLLYLPLVATIVTFSRYVIGLKSLSIFSSILLTFALYHLSRDVTGNIVLTTGFAQGGILILCSSLVVLLLQLLLTEIRIHYLAKISVAVSAVTFVILLLLFLATEYNNSTFINLNPISILIVIIVMEIFIRSYIRKGWRKSLTLIANTVGLSYLIYVIIAQVEIKNFVLSHPEIIFYTFIINLIIGRWHGLRLSEYFRFKNVHLTDSYDPEDNQV